MLEKVINLFSGDQRLNTFAADITEKCINFSAAQGIPTSTIIGVLEMVKMELVNRAMEQARD